ncbi:MAG TPA: hypothetical protein VF756_21515 [Thermoanaerobaculia bacterium]
MSLSERIQQINREISGSVERALSDLRREVSQRLRASSDEILRHIEEFTPEVPTSFLAGDELSPYAEAMASAAARSASRGAVAGLRDSVAAIDRARSQAEILAALLREAARYSSRAAVLLLRGNEMRGWGGQGFGDAEPAIRDLSFSPAAGSPWTRLAEGQSAVRLSAGDCAELCSRLETSLPHEGVLIPLVLRDKVAAGVYADRVEGELAAEALQTLCYVAAQSIELLPFRERPSTPTLTLEGEEVGFTGGTAATAPAVSAPPEPEPAAAEETPDTSAIEYGEPPVMTEEAAEPLAVAEDEPAPEPSPETLAAGGQTETSTWSAEPELSEPEPAEPEILAEAEPEAESEETQAESEPSPGWAAVSEPEPSPAATVYQPIPREAFASASQTAEIPRAEASASAPSGFAAPAAAPDATVLLQRPNLREAAPEPPPPLRPVPAPEPPSEVAPAGLAGTPEVKPPTGVDGPGWAFATSRVAVTTTDDTFHEEARRLARLLVSEIKLYNEEQVDEGRRKKDIYERLKEDIDRSRQMYEERVDPRILKTTDYFYQELVRILAAGDAKALGI